MSRGLPRLSVGMLLALLFVCALPFDAHGTEQKSTARWVTGFYVGYQTDVYPPDAIDFSSLTHIAVFSLVPMADGHVNTTLFTDSSRGPRIAKDVAARAKAHGVVPILSVGGANTAEAFRGATRPQQLAAFVKEIVDIAGQWGFEGVDIDWEPLPPQDYPSVLLLLQKLKAARPGLVLTVDLPWRGSASPLSAADGAFLIRLSAIVEQMNVMTYSMADNWGGWLVWHSSPLTGEGPDHPTSVRSTVRTYLARGLSAAKLGIGIGFYGSCWNAPVTEPLQQPLGSHVVAGDNVISFAAIRTKYYRKDRYRFDRAAQVPYLTFTAPAGAERCTFISYEDETSVAAKGRLADEYGLGGVIVWQLNEGYVIGEPDPQSLLHAVARAFHVTTDHAN